MDKQFIISEIQRTAEHGKAPGQRRFRAETNIKENDWRGKYWARWGDALVEAGYDQNNWQEAHGEKHVLDTLLRLTEKLGKFPTRDELMLERRSDGTIPSYSSIGRLCSRAALIDKLISACEGRSEYAASRVIIERVKSSERASTLGINSSQIEETSVAGYVYLVSGQAAYKIGSTRAPYRRVSEIVNQSAHGAELLHLISTDDPEGIEDY